MRYSTFGFLALAFIVAAAAAMPLLAHHSFAAEYDSKQPVTLKGAVTKIEWMNPHVYFYIDVKNDETGKVENWGWEMGAPAVIQRTGWTKCPSRIGRARFMTTAYPATAWTIPTPDAIRPAACGSLLSLTD